jgi:uncharacterized protein (TIGR02145 family)
MQKNASLLALFCITAFAQQKGIFTDTRDDKTYKTVKIGEQVWMAENLNYYVSGSRCYDNKSTNCEIYGRLYSWETAMTICPVGWHLPSETEWDKLITAINGKNEAGKTLKTRNGWRDYKKGIFGNGEDTYGFSALPGGYYGCSDGGGYDCYFNEDVISISYNKSACGYSEGSFSKVGHQGSWWSSKEYFFYEAYSYSMSNCITNVHLDLSYKTELYSVRCLQD